VAQTTAASCCGRKASTKRSIMRALVCALCLVAFPNAAAESVKMFPALRKRLEKQKLVAAQVKAVEPEEADAGPVAPAVVPPPMDAGESGFPTLPSVSTMLSDASVSLKSVNSQASTLEARVVQAQMQSESKMAKQKAAFDEKLKEQEQGNRQVIKANDDITAAIASLKSGNTAFRKRARQVEESNHALRSEIKTLQAHLGTAKDFTGKSLTSTDDSKSSLLQVLHSGPRRHQALVETGSKTKDDGDEGDDGESDDDDDRSDDGDDEAASFLAVSSSTKKVKGGGADDDDDNDGGDAESMTEDAESDDDNDGGDESFLALSSKVHKAHREQDGTASFEAAISELDSAVPAVSAVSLDPVASTSASSPGDLLETLVKDVAHLAQQEKESEKNLKQLFIRDFRAGAKRHQALMVKQKGLSASRSSLLQLQGKLTAAVAHVESMNKQLAGRLHGLGQFLQKLAHFAMAPQREVSHLIDVLPKPVTVKTEKAPVV